MIGVKHIDCGFYRVSDKAAGMLSKRAGFKKLPKQGMEQRITIDGFPFWLRRTPHEHYTDSPKRGWVWCIVYAGEPMTELDASYPGIEKLPSLAVVRAKCLMDDR